LADFTTCCSREGEKQKLNTLRRRDSRPVEPDVVLSSAEDLANDLSVKTTLRLTTPHKSFRWLRRLPPALLRGPQPLRDSAREAVRDAVVQVCEECLPELMSDKDKAVKWMEKIAACLSWYELEGPLVPSTPLTHLKSASLEDRAAWRRVEEWDEAFRSLETLLRQGLVSSFTISAERFSVSVFGEGSGKWTLPHTGATLQPTKHAPCAVICPSFEAFRTMLQENHVPFEIAALSTGGSAVANSRGGLDMRAAEDASALGQDAGSRALVSRASDASVSAVDDNRSDMRECRSDGLKVVTPDEIASTAPLSSALLFEGAWRVHALLDVLRQHFLGAPLASAPAPPTRLPRLAAPEPFSRAAAKSAEVLKTQTLPKAAPAMAAEGAAAPERRSCTSPIWAATSFQGRCDGCWKFSECCCGPSDVDSLQNLDTVRALTPLPSSPCGASSRSIASARLPDPARPWTGSGISG